MSVDRTFLNMGLTLAERALVDLMGRDNLQLEPKTMPRTRRQRASGRLRQIEQIVRRLIFLMALTLTLGPVRPRGPARTPDLPEGAELALLPTVPEWRMALMPCAQAHAGFSPFMVHAAPVSRPSGPVSTAPLLQRIRALHRLLETPDTAAKRLARTIERLRAAGEPKPMITPPASAFRLGPELGALSVALPGLLNTALETWESSG